MQVRVLLFGPEAAAVGRDSVTVEVPAGADSRTVREQLGIDWAVLAPFLGSSRLAVNHEFAGPDRKINASDEVALIGMVAGG